MCSMFYGRLLTILFFDMMAMMEDPYLMYHLQNSFFLCEFMEAPHLLNFAGMRAISSYIIVYIFNVSLFFDCWMAMMEDTYLLHHLQHSFLLLGFTGAAHLLNQMQHCNLTLVGMRAINSLLLLCIIIAVVNCLVVKNIHGKLSTIVFFHMLGVLGDPYLLHHLHYSFSLWLLIYWTICNIATLHL